MTIKHRVRFFFKLNTVLQSVSFVVTSLEIQGPVTNSLVFTDFFLAKFGSSAARQITLAYCVDGERIKLLKPSSDHISSGDASCVAGGGGRHTAREWTPRRRVARRPGLTTRYGQRRRAVGVCAACSWPSASPPSQSAKCRCCCCC